MELGLEGRKFSYGGHNSTTVTTMVNLAGSRVT